MVTAGKVVPKEEAELASSKSAPGDEASKTEKPNAKRRSAKGMGKAEAELYHERVGCGLFWAVGKFRPTNYMIVSVHTMLLRSHAIRILHVLLNPSLQDGGFRTWHDSLLWRRSLSSCFLAALSEAPQWRSWQAQL